MSKNLNLKITLSADGKQLTGSLKNAQGQVQSFGVKAQQASHQASQGFSKTRQGVESISKQLQVAQTALLGFIGVQKGLAGIGSLIKTADDYGQMAERIRLVTSTSSEYELVQSRLLEVSLATDRQLAEAQELYIQTADALGSLGYTTEQTLDVTDSLSYAFDLNAASSERAASATNAFSRSLQTGKVSALDWQSLLMATPSLVEALAQTTGKTTSQIRALGIEGKLSLTDLTEALRLSKEETQRLAQATDTTVEQAFTRLSTNFSVFIGEANQSLQVTQTLAGGVAYLAENLDVVAKVGMVALVAVTGRYANTAATAAATTLRAGVAHLTAANNAATHAGAVRVLAAAQTTAATAGRGLLTVLGGPVGLALTAAAVAASFISWGDSAKDAATANDVLARSVDNLTAKQARQRLNQLEDGYQAAQKETKKLAAQVEYLNVKLNQFPSAKNADKWRKSLEDAEGSLDTATQKVEEYNRVQQLLNDIIEGRDDSVAVPTFADPEAEKNIQAIIDRLQQQYDQTRLNEEQYLRYQLTLAGANSAQMQHAVVLHQSTAALQAHKKAQEEAAAAADKAAAKQKAAKKEQEDWVKAIAAAADPAKELQDEINKLQDAWADGLFKDENLDPTKFNAYVDGLKEKLNELNQVKIDNPAQKMGGAMQTAAGGIKEVAGAMQGMYQQGEKGYQEMAVAMQAANLVAAVGAVLNQGMGDPYTAFARMAAMAAAVVGLGVQVSMLGGNFDDHAAQNQAKQGTGTVLGDPTAKSESIAKALDITASATTQLVGINRGMLRALQNMQAGITGASLLITRGFKNVNFGPKQTPTNAFDSIASLGTDFFKIPGLDLVDKLSFGLGGGIFKGIGKLLGGSSKVTDWGVHLLGGSLADLMEEVVVHAYQTTQSKKYKWSSKKTSHAFDRIDSEAEKQFSLVFSSMADAVFAGATALGFSQEHLERQINSYQVATQIISTAGLTAEQQQKEIEAVFSSIFDGLAGATVSFIHKFQQAGEGLGETLARVATNVQVSQEAAFRLGFKEITAQTGDYAPVEAAAAKVGQLQQVVAQNLYYLVANGEKSLLIGHEIYEQNLNALSQAQAEYAQALHNYQGQLEEQARAYTELIELAGGLEAFINSMGSFVSKFASEEHQFALLTSDMQRAFEQVGLTVPATRDAMWDLMQTLDSGTAEGRQQIATLLELTDASDAYYKALEDQGKVLEALLGQELGEELADYFKNLSEYIQAEQQAIQQDYQERINLLERQANLSKQLGDYVASLRLSDLSPAAPAEKLTQAGEELAELLVKAQAGDLEAAAKLQGAADTYLQNADSYYGRSDAYTYIFEDVAKQLEDLGLDLAATSTEEHIKSLNEQMLAEQQAQRDLLQQELDWAVAHYDKLTSIEQLLAALPNGLGATITGQLEAPNNEPPVLPVRPVHGSHASGLANVPFNGYVAELHKGEAVLTAAENRALSQFNTQPLADELKQIRTQLEVLTNENSQLRADNAQLALRAEAQRNAQLQVQQQLERNNRQPIKVT